MRRLDGYNASREWKCLAAFYILIFAPKGTKVHARTHLVQDGLNSSIFRVQTEDLSITVKVVFWGLQGEADYWRTRFRVCDLGKVSQSNMQ